MLINTEKEAEEYFKHNPKDKKLYFVMITEDQIDEAEENSIIDVLHTEENK